MTKENANPTLRLLSAKEASESLGISQRKLWSLTNAKAIASIRIGRAIRYFESDLLEFANAQRTVPK